jgi:hypothetical protein
MVIHRRLEGIPTRDVYNESRKLLGRTQESWLANWAIIQGKLGHSPPLTHFRYYAQRLLKNNGIVHKLGKHWYTGYLVRNSEVRSSRIRLINYKRANAALIDNINIFFDRLELPEVRIIFS